MKRIWPTEAGKRLMDEEWDNFDVRPWGSPLVILIAWTLGALFAWAVIHVGARSDPPEWDDVQPLDPYTVGLSESSTGGPSVTVRTNDQTYTYASGGSRDWRN